MVFTSFAFLFLFLPTFLAGYFARFPRERIHELRQAYRMLFASEGTLMERLEDVDKMFSANPLVRQIVEFITAHSDRSFCVPNNNVPASSQD